MMLIKRYIDKIAGHVTKNFPVSGWYENDLENYVVLNKKEATKYGNYLSREWTHILSPSELLAIVLYKGFLGISFHKNINNALRNNDTQSKWYTIAKLICHALSNTAIDSNIVCFRETNKQFLSANGFDVSSIKTGDILIEKGFLSTFANRPFFTRGKIRLMIMVPSGTKGAYINSVSIGNRWEQEFLFLPCIKFIVVDICRRPRRIYLKLKMVD